MLGRFEKNARTKKWPHREVAKHLQFCGFEPDAPESGNRPYVRWTVAGTARSITIYQEGSGLMVHSGPLLEFLLTLPGATEPTGVHPRMKWHYAASVGTALNVATILCGHADAS